MRVVTNNVASEAYDATKRMVDAGAQWGMAIESVTRAYVGEGYSEDAVRCELIQMSRMVRIVGAAA